MQKLDWRKTLKHLYVPSAREVVEVDVPEMRFLMVDGERAPSASDAFAEASEALYALSYALKFMVKKRRRIDYGVSPLEGLWWMEEMDPSTFQDEEAVRRAIENREAWRWTAMIMQPEPVTRELFEETREDVARKKDLPALESLRYEPFLEGRSAQILHVGSYAEEGPSIERVHRFIEARGGTIRGKHHEIYLNDPGRTAPQRLKTVIRQPFE